MGKELENAIDDAQKKLVAMADDLTRQEKNQPRGKNREEKSNYELIERCRLVAQRLQTYIKELSELKKALKIPLDESITIQMAERAKKTAVQQSKEEIDSIANYYKSDINTYASRMLDKAKTAQEEAEKKIEAAKGTEFKEIEIFSVTVDGFLDMLEKHDVEPTEAMICSLIEAVSYFKWRKMNVDETPKKKRI